MFAVSTCRTLSVWSNWSLIILLIYEIVDNLMAQKISTDIEWPPEVTACVKADLGWLFSGHHSLWGLQLLQYIFVNSCFWDASCKGEMCKTHIIWNILYYLFIHRLAQTVSPETYLTPCHCCGDIIDIRLRTVSKIFCACF